MVMPMKRTAKPLDRLMMDFYLPCAISGLLLAGLIALTTPDSPVGPITEPAIVVALN